MSEQDEDFAAMFEASVKALRFDRGQTNRSVKQKTLPQALEWLWKHYQAGAVKN